MRTSSALSKPKILILTASNPARNPRPRRMIENLRGKAELFALGIGSEEIMGVQVESYPSYHKRNFLQELKLYGDVFLRRWDRLIYTDNRRQIIPYLQAHSFDFILCFDLPLLPIVLQYKKKAKVIFDAQEYFPEWLTSSLRWNLLFKRFYFQLCKNYLSRADALLTVSPSFVQRYGREFDLSLLYYPSLPYFYEGEPKVCDKRKMKILYHGSLSANRSIEQLIQLSDFLEDHLELHLVLVGGEAKYRKSIETALHLAQQKGRKIFLHPPVAFEEIIPFGTNFDIGLYFMPPKTYNLLCTLPNKVFEYIGSSLMLVSTPNPDVAQLICDYGVGRVSEDFSLSSIARLLNALSPNEIQSYKLASNTAHKKLNNKQNQALILGLLDSLISSK